MAISKPTAQVVIDLTGTALSESVVSAIIDDAALMAEKCIESYEADRQEAIVKWLAAHLISSGPEGVVSSEQLGDAQTVYARAQGQLGDMLSMTAYGQQALALDLNGCLARLGRAKAEIQVI